MKNKIIAVTIIITILTIGWFMGSKPAVPVNDENVVNSEENDSIELNEEQENKDELQDDSRETKIQDNDVAKSGQSEELDTVDTNVSEIEENENNNEDVVVTNETEENSIDNTSNKANESNPSNNSTNELMTVSNDIEQEEVKKQENKDTQSILDTEQEEGKQENDTQSISDIEQEVDNDNESSESKQQDLVETEVKNNKKDKYLTDPVPEGKPQPVEPQDVEINELESFQVELSVSCNVILKNMDLLDENKVELVPEDGKIYKTKKVTAYEGESVFDILLREMKDNKIHMEFSNSPVYNSAYIEGINNIYQFDAGDLSGWMYKVNGWFPNYGCSRYQVEENDKIEWLYTCDLGRDIGGDVSGGSLQ